MVFPSLHDSSYEMDIIKHARFSVQVTHRLTDLHETDFTLETKRSICSSLYTVHTSSQTFSNIRQLGVIKQRVVNNALLYPPLTFPSLFLSNFFSFYAQPIKQVPICLL